jgi:hypothetical protein
MPDKTRGEEAHRISQEKGSDHFFNGPPGTVFSGPVALVVNEPLRHHDSLASRLGRG